MLKMIGKKYLQFYAKKFCLPKPMRSPVAQWQNVTLGIEGSLVCHSPESLHCVLAQGTYLLLSTVSTQKDR